MNQALLKAALIEAQKREQSKSIRIDLSKFLFAQQLNLISDPRKFKTACLPRRSGKTTVCAFDLVNTALTSPNTVSLYVTLARSNAKKLIWPLLLDICRNINNLKYTPNETDLSIKFPNGSIIYCSGAKDKSEIEKFRGLALKCIYIDEAQSFRDYLEELINDVISPALRDYNGKCTLIGTPGPKPQGYFYDCTQSPNWSNHFWTGNDNIYLQQKSGQTFEEQLNEELERLGVDRNNPTIQREWFGFWTLDLNRSVFKYDDNLNHFDSLPEGKWNYVIGVDIGFVDADAIAVLGWVDNSTDVYIVEEYVKSKQGIDELAHTIINLRNKYDPHKIVADAGGLGKKIIEDINKRFGLYMEAADKREKFASIEILNTALRKQNLYARNTGPFAHDSKFVEWETPLVKLKDTYHSDITDAVLYGFKICPAYAEVVKPTKQKKTEEQISREQLDLMEQNLMEQARKEVELLEEINF